MKAKKWKGITFASDYDKSFADFKKEFSGVQDFRDIPEKDREKAFKDAYKIAKPKAKNVNIQKTASEATETEKTELS